MDNKKLASSVLFTKASEELEEEVKKELDIPDPPPGKVNAMLKLKEANEDTEEHDRTGSSGGNRKGCK